MRTEPSKNRFFLITQPAEPQVGCCLATLVVLLASLLALLVLLASLLVLLVLLVLLASLLCQLAAWLYCEENCAIPLKKFPHCDTNHHGQAFLFLCTFGI